MTSVKKLKILNIWYWNGNEATGKVATCGSWFNHSTQGISLGGDVLGQPNQRAHFVSNSFDSLPNLSDTTNYILTYGTLLIQDENRRQEEREFQGDKYLLHYFDFKTDDKVYVIWALTAGILISTASLVYQCPPDFEPRRPKFWTKNYSRF